MNILVVNAYNLFAHPARGNGNVMRIRSMLDALIRCGHKVDLFQYDVKSRAFAPSDMHINVSNHAVSSRVLMETLWKRVFSGMRLYDYIKAKDFPFRSYAESLKRIIEARKTDVVILENMWAVPPFLKSGVDIPAIFTAHDVVTDRYRQKLEKTCRSARRTGRIMESVNKMEKEALLNCDAVVCMCEEDKREFIRYGTPESKLTVIPNGVDTEKIYPRTKNYDLRRKYSLKDADIALMFSGSDMFHNVQAAEDIIRKILPSLRTHYPDVHLFLVGGVAEATGKKLQSDDLLRSVSLIERTDDINEYYAAADIYVYPCFSGGGTKLKVIEAMAAGMPVVSTSMGFRGYEVSHAEDAFIEDDLERFDLAIGELCRNKKLRLHLGRNAAAKASVYDEKRLMNSYNDIIEKLHKVPESRVLLNRAA